MQSINVNNGFFDEANRIKDDIDVMKDKIETVEQLQNRIINATGENENSI